VIKLLFHYTTISFDLPRLFLFFGFYLMMACLTVGTSVAAGLFYPSMVAGAALGRILGQLLQMTFSNSVVDPGTYAFIGCAAVLGGCMRMTVSVAVMMLESTGDYQYGLPIMATLIAARWTGNLFNHSVYDVSIELQHWPHLEDHIKKSVASNLVVADIMSPNPVVFREVEKVGTIIDVLRGTKHNGFPVLHATNTLEYNPRLGTLAGVYSVPPLIPCCVALSLLCGCADCSEMLLCVHPRRPHAAATPLCSVAKEGVHPRATARFCAWRVFHVVHSQNRAPASCIHS
jgi:CBS domain-containing protein